MPDQPESSFVSHLPCTNCGSHDANSLFSDGHTYCFSCGNHRQGDGSTSVAAPTVKVDSRLIVGTVIAHEKRGLTQETCATFNYQYGELRGRPCHIAPYYDKDGVMVAQKLRFQDKSFMVLGDLKTALPFGAQAWPKTGRMLVVTEGEVDALSMSQVQGNRWPVVSIACGAGPQVKKYIAKHREYFLGFEKVIVMFDMDQPGRDASRLAAEVIGPRARIAELTMKDANEMLLGQQVGGLISAMWQAKEYRPEGIVDMMTLKEQVKERPTQGLTWPFESLTKLTYGIRTGEIYSFGAGTGIGKTDLFTQTVEHLVTHHHVPVGVFALEQAPRETAARIAGKFARKTFHIPESGWSSSDLDAAWDSLMQSGKVFLYDSFGNNDWDIIKEKIEYLAHAENVRHFFLDHLTALAAWQDDERKELESIMSEMGALVKKLDCALFLISHLATPDGKPHEEGGRVTIRHFKGSRAIGFWSHYMFGLERDQQADAENVRKTTTFRVLKDRYTGRATGEIFYLRYDQETGMLYETVAPELQTGEGYGLAAVTTPDPSKDF